MPSSGDLSIAYRVLAKARSTSSSSRVCFLTSNSSWSTRPRPASCVDFHLFARVIAFDKRGQGLSDRPAAPPTLELDGRPPRCARRDRERESGRVRISEGADVDAVCGHPPRAGLVADPDWDLREDVDGARLLRLPSRPSTVVIRPDRGQPAALDLGAVDERRHRVRRVVGAAAADEPRRSNRADRSLPRDAGVLSSISAPTLVVHRSGDRLVRVDQAGTSLSTSGAPSYAELPGEDHSPNGRRPGRGHRRGRRVPDRPPPRPGGGTTAFSRRSSSPTSSARPRRRATSATRLADLLDQHHAIVRRELARFPGEEIDTAGDGFFATLRRPGARPSTAPRIRDAGPASGSRCASGVHTGEVELDRRHVSGIAVTIGAQDRRPGRLRRGARLQHRARPGRRLRPRVRRPRPARAQGRAGEWRLFAVA